MIPNFVNTSLSMHITPGGKVKTSYRTVVLRMRGGFEERIGEWQDALREFDLVPVLRAQSDLQDLIAFYRVRNGPEFAFKILDITDFTADEEYVGTGDGIITQFQLVKRYNSGLSGDSHFTVRPIILPDNNVHIFFDAVEQFAGFTVDLDTGIVTFGSPPGVSVDVTWSGTFQVPVRFTTIQMYASIEVYQKYEAPLILREVRTPVPSFILAETASPDFVDVSFPYDFAERSQMGPEVAVIINPSDSGQESRVSQYSEPKICFRVDHLIKTTAQAEILINFFHARRGKLIGFRVRDITDYQVTNQAIGIGDASEDTFQLIKYYPSGALTQIRTIVKPSTWTIYLAGVPQVGGYTINSVGQVIFTSPPGVGVAITWTGEFDVPVRFNTDTLDLELPYAGDDVVKSWGNIELVEIEVGDLDDIPGLTVNPPGAFLP